MSKKRSSTRSYLEKQKWAILPEALEEILAQASENIEAFFDVGDNAISAFTKDGDKAIINITGVIFKRSNILSLLGIGTSIENVSAQFEEALKDNAVKEIVFNFDTPGGEATAAINFAEKIYNNRGKKPLKGVVNGTLASAGYVIASALDSIMATNETDMIGSLGVMMTLYKGSNDERVFISSNAPRKNPDPDSENGKEVYQGVVDRLEDVLITKVARNRGVSEDYVKASYGKGDILLAQEALKVGMIDELLNYNNNGGNMDEKELKAKYSSIIDNIVAEALQPVKAENDELKEKLNALTAQDDKLPEEVRAQITSLEKQLLQTKLSGCLEEIQNDLMALHGKLPVDDIVALGERFKELQAKITTASAPIGDSSTEDNLQAKIDAEIEKLVAEGHSQTTAYTMAYKKYA